MFIIHNWEPDHSVHAVEKCHCAELPNGTSLIYCSSQIYTAYSACRGFLLSFSCHLLLIKHGIDFFQTFLHIKLCATCSMRMWCLLSLYKTLCGSLSLNHIGLISTAVSIIWFQSDIPLCPGILHKKICVMIASFDPAPKREKRKRKKKWWHLFN